MFGIESILEVVSLSPEVMFAVGGFALNLLVLPTLLDSNSAVPRVQSVFSSFVILVCFAVPYYSMGFYWPALANSIGFVLWGFVAIYRAPSMGRNEDASETVETVETVESSMQPAD